MSMIHHHVNTQDMAVYLGLIVIVELNSTPGPFDVRLQAVDEEFAYFGRTGLRDRTKIALANIKSVELAPSHG